MSSVQERLQLKRVPLDTWNIREQLCLASAVVRSGDQNWMSVSRALKTVGEPNRPPDWYSQKSCAAQYGALLEHVETPKRKKRSSEGAVETPQESILKRLTQERIVEIQKNVAEMTQQYELLRNDVMEARNPATSEDRLREMWAEIEAAKRARERDNAKRAAWLKEREERRARAERVWRPTVSVSSAAAPVAPSTPSSPLLTSLLKSSPVVTTPQHISHPATVVDAVSPSAGAPTLSMLLEKSGSTSPQNKMAAIEHIKNQLVQIEQQLKANSSPPLPAPLTAPPAPPSLPAPLPPAPPVDIDDIEIKAEDVYAFRDIDIHLPTPTLHKSLRASLDRLGPKEEPVPAVSAPPEGTALSASTQGGHVHSVLKGGMPPVPTTAESEHEDLMPIDVETVPTPEESHGPLPTVPAVGRGSQPIAFPEVRFPAPEIKVPLDHDQPKEEVKEPESTPAGVDKELEVEVTVDDEPTAGQQHSEPDPPEESQPIVDAEGQPTLTVECPPPEDIPLPETDPPAPPAPPAPSVTEPPLPPDPEPPLPEIKQETPEIPDPVEQPEVDPEVKAELVEEGDSRKDDDAEDSIPLKEMAREESDRKSVQPEPEIKEEPSAEPEDVHTETDDDTPMELSRVEEMDGKKKRDYSRKKKPESRTCSGSESAAEASAPESPMGSDAERQHRLWKKSVMPVYSRLCAHKYASLFLRPISDEEAPGYSIVVKRPMDLTTIRKNIDAGLIRTTSEFQREVLQMLVNALMYNSSEHSVYHMAKDMFQEASTQLDILMAAQAHAGLGGAPAPGPASAPPARRKRRRHSSQSQNTPTHTSKRAH